MAHLDALIEEQALAELEMQQQYINQLRAEGKWVYVWKVIDEPASVDVLAPVVGPTEAKQARQFKWLMIQAVASEAEASGRQATIRPLPATSRSIRPVERPREGRVFRSELFQQYAPFSDYKEERPALLLQRQVTVIPGVYECPGISRKLHLRADGTGMQIEAWDSDGEFYDLRLEQWDSTIGLLQITFIKASTSEEISSTIFIKGGELIEQVRVVDREATTTRTLTWKKR
jgi:hypothetical protein